MGLLQLLGLTREQMTLKRETTGELAFQAQIADFWANMTTAAGFSSSTLVEKVWVVNRCIQMNAQAISSMPLRHFGGREPAWVANPDPVWFPNGIGDAVFAAVFSRYAYGDAFLLVTSRYADGFPSGWTVLDAQSMRIEVRRGRRQYEYKERRLDPGDVVQISRDPRGNLKGTSLIQSYSAYANGLLAAADLGRVMMGSGTPNAVIRSAKRLDEEQAAQIQNQWMTAVAARRGAPAILPPELTFEQLAFSPADLLLLDAQQFDAQVLATAAGIPAQLVNLSIEGGLNYQTPILLMELWWRSELRTTTDQIAKALSANWLPRGAYVEFDARSFLAPSFAEHVESWLSMREAGLITDEEFRAVVLGLPPQAQEDALADLSTPPSAGASPAQQPSSVIALRPTGTVST